MSIWKCPHCSSVQEITGDQIYDFKCNKLNCGGILDKLDEPEASAAVFEAFFNYNHGFTSVLTQSPNTDLERLAESLAAIEPREIGGTP